MEIMAVPIIVVLCYGLIELIKIVVKNEKFYNFFPIIAGVFGVILGVVAFYFVPGVIMASNVFYAGFIGLISGLSSTGSNQLVKQIKEFYQGITKSNN